MMAMTTKEFIGQKAEYDDSGQIIWAVDKQGGYQMLLQLRGWGAIQNLFETEKEAMKFQDELGEWIADAINQKLNK